MQIKNIKNTKLGDVVEDVRTVSEKLNDTSIYIPVFYPTV